MSAPKTAPCQTLKIKLSYNHIVSLGLVTLVIFQIVITALAFQHSNRATKAMETITGPLSTRQNTVNQLSKSVSQAYYLFQLDKTGRLVTQTDILATLGSLKEKIRLISQQTLLPADKTALSKSTEFMAALHQGVQSLASPQNKSVDQIRDPLTKLTTLFHDLALAWGNDNIRSPKRLLLIGEAMDLLKLFEAKVRTFIERQNADPETILLILAHAEAALTDLDISQLNIAANDPKKLLQVRKLLALLRTKIPLYHETLTSIDPILLSNGGQDSLDQTWAQLVGAVDNLKDYEEALSTMRKSHILNESLQNRSRFFLLTCLLLTMVVITTIVMRSILQSRIQELLAGIQKIAQGDFTYRLDIFSKDHLGSLAQSFNEMAESQAAKEHELQRTVEHLRVSKMQLGLSHLDLEDKVLERTADVRAANEKLQLMGEVFEHSLEGIIILDMEGRIIKVNPSFTELTVYTEQEAIGKDSRLLETDVHDLLPYDQIRKTVMVKGSWDGEVWIQRKDKEVVAIWLSLSTMSNEDGVNTGFIAIFHDISELKNQADLIQHQALHDPLTELPNRLLLKDRMDVAISHAKRSKEKLAIIFLDLDNFKTINDSLGHDHGDLLLQEVAARLKDVVRPGDTVCRMGGDEFVVLVDNLEAKDGVRVVATRIQKELTSPFTIKDRNLFISASIGISFFPDDGHDSETLIKHADLAMYQAKGKGKNTIQLFTASMNKAALERLTLEGEIRTALDSDEFTIHLQPKIDLASMKVVGMEALARWQNPSRGMVSPLKFIPICEEAGLIIPLGLNIFETSCRQGVELIQSKPLMPLHIAINLSIKQLQYENIIADIQRVIKETGIKPADLEFEITESVLMSDPERTLKTLHQIADMGINIAIDDFGTGYSSLFYLKHFPVTTLKIDKSFVDDLTLDTSSDQIVETIIAMAQRLKLKVVAEGVETKAQLDFLANMGCDMIQGYYFSKPLPIKDIPAFISSFNGK